jgi:MOSC domain-containing protein YiiM
VQPANHFWSQSSIVLLFPDNYIRSTDSQGSVYPALTLPNSSSQRDELVRILSVNVALPSIISDGNQDVLTGIGKQPVAAPVMLRNSNIDGDGQADLKNHGGPDQAVYAFPREHYNFYSNNLDLPKNAVPFGFFGENLTTTGMLESDTRIGDQYKVGDAILEVTQPRSPCYKFALKTGDSSAIRTMVRSGRTGFYLRVLQEGLIETGPVTPVFTDATSPTVLETHKILFVDICNVSEMQRILNSPALGVRLRNQISDRLEKIM